MPLSINPCRECDVSHISRDETSGKYFKEYPFCDSIAAGPEGAQGHVLLKPGAFVFRKEILSIPGLAGFRYMFGVNYNTANGIKGILGPGFNFSQNNKLEKPRECGDPEVCEGTCPPVASPCVDLTLLDLVTGENIREGFEHPPDSGRYCPEESTGNNTAAKITCCEDPIRGDVGLCCRGGREYCLYSSRGALTVFHGFDCSNATPGYIKSITDRWGTTQTYEWKKDTHPDDATCCVQLIKVTESYGREINYTYYTAADFGGNTQDKRICLMKEITDFLGRKVNFQYDDEGRLTVIVMPSINQAVNIAGGDNRFPNGTAYVFDWTTIGTGEDAQDVVTKVYYPKEVAAITPTVFTGRSVDFQRVYSEGANRLFVEYDDNESSPSFQMVERITIGDGAGVGGTYHYSYAGMTTTEIDRNGNETTYTFTSDGMAAEIKKLANRNKLSTQAAEWITATEFNEHNQPLKVTHPRGNIIEFEYEDPPHFTPCVPYERRQGLLLTETRSPGAVGGQNDQAQLTKRYFYEPIYNEMHAVIEERGNPVGGAGEYFEPQNGNGTGFSTPTDADRRRYTTFTDYDIQKSNAGEVASDVDLQALLFPEVPQPERVELILDLIAFVDAQMQARGLPDGFQFFNSDINGDGDTSGKKIHKGNAVRTRHPKVRLIGQSSIVAQESTEIFTRNQRGQLTTTTDPEGNIMVTQRYPWNNPSNQVPGPGINKQYGWDKATIVDVDPASVMALVGGSGDMTSFTRKVNRDPNVQPNVNIYLELVTEFPKYDLLGNYLETIDPRSTFSKVDRSELGEVFRSTSPEPLEYRRELFFDANRNLIREDTEDKIVAYSEDYPNSGFAKVELTDVGVGDSMANFQINFGPGGATRPGWFTNLSDYDLLNNKIKASVDVEGSAPNRVETHFRYDKNENLILEIKPELNTIEIDYDERDLKIAERSGNKVSTVNGPVEIVIEGGEEVAAPVVFSFDENRNSKLVIAPADRDGNPGTNQTVTIADAFGMGLPLVHTGNLEQDITYDGYDRATLEMDAIGDTAKFEYDPGSRCIRDEFNGPIGGPSPTNRNGTGNETLSESKYYFNERGNQYEAQKSVFAVDAALPSGRTVTHTGGGLQHNSVANDHTDTVTLIGPASGESFVLQRLVHDRMDREHKSIVDNAQTMTQQYDGASRVIRTTDALENSNELSYDQNGNLTESKVTEKSNDPTLPQPIEEVFRSQMRYDVADRLTVMAEQGKDGSIGNDPTNPADTSTLFTVIGYDSRNNKTTINDPRGNTAIYTFDALNRQRMCQQHLRTDGSGANSIEKTITTTIEYDKNSRVRSREDDNLAKTDYEYDTLDRENKLRFPDPKSLAGSNRAERKTKYNKASDVMELTDENGSVFNYTYDGMGRIVRMEIDKAGGIGGTDEQTYQHDGLHRRTQSEDITTGESLIKSTLAYDSLGRDLEEQHDVGGQPGAVTSHAFTSYQATGTTYPNNRKLASAFDPLYRRVRTGEEGAPPAQLILKTEFVGPSRVTENILGNGLVESRLNNARTKSALQEGDPSPAWGNRSSDRLGCDGAGRPITKRFLNQGLAGGGGYQDTSAVVGFTYDHDKASNKLFKRHLHVESRSERYPATRHDSIDRLKEYARGLLASGGGGVTTPTSLPGVRKEQTYALDGVGNWSNTTHEDVLTFSGMTVDQWAELQVEDLATLPVADAEPDFRDHNFLEQIESVTINGQTTNIQYDGSTDGTGNGNGNMTDDGLRLMTYDALNRLISVVRKSDSALIAKYRYDASGRRVIKEVFNGGLNGGVPNGVTQYFHLGSHCVEEHSPSQNGLVTQYVWGDSADDLIQIRRVDSGALDETQYILSDTHQSAAAVTNQTGAIQEAYDTDAYGKTLAFSAPGTGVGNDAWFADDTVKTSAPKNGHIYTGSQFDPESGLYYFRARYYNPELGRFLERDPEGYVGAMGLYEYAASMPTAVTDPHGRYPQDKTVTQPDRRDPNAGPGIGVGHSKKDEVINALRSEALFLQNRIKEADAWWRPKGREIRGYERRLEEIDILIMNHQGKRARLPSEDPFAKRLHDDTNDEKSGLENAADFFAGWGDTLSFNLTKKARGLMGDWWDIGGVDTESGWYAAGEWTGTAQGFFFGGAHAGRNALYQMAGRGRGFWKGVGRGLGRLFSDKRQWASVMGQWSRQAGNGTRVLLARGQDLHHWLIPQRVGRWLGPWSTRFVNSGLNYIPTTARFNQWMGRAQFVPRATEWLLRGLVVGHYGAMFRGHGRSSSATPQSARTRVGSSEGNSRY